MKIIAESAFNHNGSLNYLKQLAKVSKEAGADYFTVQLMEVDAFCTEDYSKRKIYEENSFTFSQWKEVFTYCENLRLEIIPCILDVPSLLFCINEGFRFLKIHATDISNVKMLKEIANTKGIRIILETQCATDLELKFALEYIGDKVECLMHGFSNYPTEVEDLNLNTLNYFKSEYPQYNTGMADHTLDTNNIPLMVLAKGCKYLEKHITLSRNSRNFDYQVSLYPHEFATMVSQIRHYEIALGKKKKHPVKNELPFREVMYKKFLSPGEFKRADGGKDFVTHQFHSFNRKDISVALIARLKSQRLPMKVLEPLEDKPMIDFLYQRLKRVKKAKEIYLTTSTLPEDTPLSEVGKKHGHKIFRGHPLSVIDRMLELALKEELGGIFRVTGDNPLTDPLLMDEMIDLFLQNDLDYVRVNNLPFGLSAELFSTAYLWDLYLQMENPMDSEYLTLFILQDMKATKGCIDIKSTIPDLKYINLSVDYPQDLNRVKLLASTVRTKGKRLMDLNIEDYIDTLTDFEREDQEKIVKLPRGTSESLSKYLKDLDNQEYKVRKEIIL